jgi:hypothetical protein
MRIIFFLLMAIAVSLEVQGQSPDSIAKELNRYNQIKPQEKVYLHLDRSYYSPGDTVWFKAYLVKATNHTADLASKNLYVDFLKKANGKLVEHIVLKNEGGFSHGALDLPDSLPVGAYEIRAYTNWMRNFPENYFFSKDVFVLDKTAMGQGIDVSGEVDDLQFFAEGGDLVEGLENRMAFKAVNNTGQGVDFKGYIISEQEDTIVKIQSQHLGMGNFIFTPEPEVKYYAIVENQLSAKQYELPVAKSQGYTLFVDNVSDPAVIKVITQNNFSDKELPILIAQQRSKVVAAFQSKVEGNYFAWGLPRKNFTENGVVQVTLFNDLGEPQCERVIYLSGQAPLQISVSADKTEYKPREKVVLSIHATDGSNNPIAGNFSLSVTDSKQVQVEPNGITISNYLYLTSDIEELTGGKIIGNIEEPNYYFNPANPNAQNHLDILLMTQGWRRFLWKEVLAKTQTAPKFEIERGIDIHGTVELKDGKELEKPMKVILSYYHSTDSIANISTTTDLLGGFRFSVTDIKGESKVFLRGVKEKGNRDFKLGLELNEMPGYNSKPGSMANPFINRPRQVQFYPVKIDNQDSKVKGKVLREVTVRAKRVKPEQEIDSRRMLYQGYNVKTVEVDKGLCVSARSVLSMLEGQVSGLIFSIRPDGTYVPIIRGISSFGISGDPLPAILVDGVPVTLSYLDNIPPCDVKSIDVVTSNVTLLNARGVISILTVGANDDRGQGEDLENIPGIVTSKVLGYQASREFYSPKHPITETHKAENHKDLRSTLYWNPIIKTDSKGDAKVTFYNSDNATTIHADLHGISVNGKPACTTFNYNVK